MPCHALPCPALPCCAVQCYDILANTQHDTHGSVVWLAMGFKAKPIDTESGEQAYAIRAAVSREGRGAL